MRYKRNNSEDGDTLVEVLLATVLLSVVLVSAYTLSNRATRINQQAFERTQVSNALQQQAELMRAARDAYIPSQPSHTLSVNWTQALAQAKSSMTDPESDCNDISTLAANRTGEFYIDDTNTYRNGILTSSDNPFNIWIEVERGSSGDYWDVHVFGCWEALGNNPTNLTAVILRLEDPDD